MRKKLPTVVILATKPNFLHCTHRFETVIKPCTMTLLLLPILSRGLHHLELVESISGIWHSNKLGNLSYIQMRSYIKPMIKLFLNGGRLFPIGESPPPDIHTRHHHQPHPSPSPTEATENLSALLSLSPGDNQLEPLHKGPVTQVLMFSFMKV